MSKSDYFKKLFAIKQFLNEYYDDDISYIIVKFYYYIEEEHKKFDYVYKNINFMKYDDYLIEMITDLNLDILVLSSKNKTLIFDKFIYIISVSVNFKMNTKINQIIINKYLPKIINNGSKHDVINACLVCFNAKYNNENIIIDFDYYHGLIECLQSSPRWNENILYFHNKKLISKYDLEEIFNDVTRYLYIKGDNFCYGLALDLFGDKSDFIFAK
jgi:hypothetical protein